MTGKTFAFAKRQLIEIQKGGCGVLFTKMKLALLIVFNLSLSILAIPAVVVLHIIRPWLLVRLNCMPSSRIGHFAANIELYLCERDADINVPKQRYLDLFYMGYRPVCNQQLAIMWKRILRVWPSWILTPISRANRLILGREHHYVGNHDRDVYNLYDRFPPHLEFTPKETARGEAGLRAIGIPSGIPFVCLIVRDRTYLDAHLPGTDWSYLNFRDSDIENYMLAAEELVARGYYVIRMGVNVEKAMNTVEPRIIDYATNGMRSDFMDIFLGARCEFCISVSCGFDAVPIIFRRPIVYVNMVPLGLLPTYSTRFLGITKHHWSAKKNRDLTLREIFDYGIDFYMDTSDYESKSIKLIENTPEEIRDVVIEMAERLSGKWQPQEDDEALQRCFWEIFSTGTVNNDRRRPLHGQFRSCFGARFLRDNRDWLQ